MVQGGNQVSWSLIVPGREDENFTLPGPDGRTPLQAALIMDSYDTKTEGDEAESIGITITIL